MLIGYLSSICFLLFSLYWLSRNRAFQLDGLSKTYFFFGYGIKLLSAFMLWGVYTYFYDDRANADIFKYFDDANYIFNATQEKLLLRIKILFGFSDLNVLEGYQTGVNFWDSQSEIFFNDNRTMIRLHLLLLSFSKGNYLFHLLFFALLSFLGSFGLFTFFRSFSSLPNKILFAISFLPPSLLFWSSSPLKESYLLFCLGLLLWGVAECSHRLSVKAILYIFLGIVTLFSIKLYILLSILPAILVLYLSSKMQSKIKPLLIVSLILIGIAILFQETIVTALSDKQLNFKQLAEQSNAKSTISLGSYHNLMEFIFIQPQALFNVYLKPAWPPNWNLFTLIAALEHWFYLLIILLPFLFRRKPTSSERSIILFSFFILLVAGSIIGSTTPILGAIVRYKSPLIPFYLIIIFTLTDSSKFTLTKQ